MSKIVLARIDDRLIHGQVMTAWVQYTNANEVIVVDVKVASDPFLTDIITSAVPEKLTAHVFDPDDAAKYILNEKSENRNYLLLAKTPEAYQKLIEKGVKLGSIDVGGMGQKGDRTQLYRNIAASPSERECFKNLIHQNVDVYIQVVPANKKIKLTKELLG